MKVNLFQWYKELPDWAQGAVIVGGLALTWFGVANPVRKLIMKKLDETKAVKEGVAAGNELDKLRKKGIVPTINKAQAEGMSNSLQAAFAGCGTDASAVFRVFQQLKNDADVYYLINVYGVRIYDACNWEFDFGDKNLSLSGAISDELGFVQKDYINRVMKEKGITYQFS